MKDNAVDKPGIRKYSCSRKECQAPSHQRETRNVIIIGRKSLFRVEKKQLGRMPDFWKKGSQ